jgi:large subunit ribosomal protein L29
MLPKSQLIIMKKKEIQDLKIKSPAELARLIKEAEEKLRTFRFDLAAGKVKDISRIKELKKTVARMKTFAREKKG